MKNLVFNKTKAIFLGLVFIQIFSLGVFAQKPKPKTQAVKLPPKPTVNLSKVTQIDEAGLKAAIKTNGKPLLVNFWATWCDPCREEFPDLVKIDTDYKGKIDFITVSLDDLAEINRDVPKFLSDMKAEMPAYLLKVEDEGAVIGSITKDWQGGLPFTILYNDKGEIAYFRQGKIKTETVRGEIEKLITPTPKQN
jgi:thiol-disulfide isomerase/thioredoxin